MITSEVAFVQGASLVAEKFSTLSLLSSHSGGGPPCGRESGASQTRVVGTTSMGHRPAGLETSVGDQTNLSRWVVSNVDAVNI